MHIPPQIFIEPTFNETDLETEDNFKILPNNTRLIHKSIKKDLTAEEIIKTLRMVVVVTFIAWYFAMTAICTLISLVILAQKNFAKNAFSTGQRFLAVLNLLLAIVMILRYFVRGNIGNDLSEYNAPLCRIYKTASFVIASNANWCVVYLTFIRYMSIKYPMKVCSQGFEKVAYIWMFSASVSQPLFYAIVYHSFTKVFTERVQNMNPNECTSYGNFPMNVYLFRILLKTPGFLLPAISLVIFNILTYSEYKVINMKRTELKQELRRRSKIILDIKMSLAEHVESKKASWDASYKRKRVASWTEGVIAEKQRLSTDTSCKSEQRSSLEALQKTQRNVDIMLRLAPYVQSLRQSFATFASRVDLMNFKAVGDVEANESVEALSGEQVLLDKLKQEKATFRKTTVAYDYLRCLDSVPLQSCAAHAPKLEQKIISCSSATQTLVTSTTFTTKLNANRLYAESTLLLKRTLIVNTLMFILLFGPDTIWYTISPLVLGKIESLIKKHLIIDLIFFLENTGHFITFFPYIFSSAKVRTEGRKLLVRFCQYHL